MSNIVGNYFRPAPLTKTRALRESPYGVPAGERQLGRGGRVGAASATRGGYGGGRGGSWGVRGGGGGAGALGGGSGVRRSVHGRAVSAEHGFWAGAPSRGATPEPGHGSRAEGLPGRGASGPRGGGGSGFRAGGWRIRSGGSLWAEGRSPSRGRLPGAGWIPGRPSPPPGPRARARYRVDQATSGSFGPGRDDPGGKLSARSLTPGRHPLFRVRQADLGGGRHRVPDTVVRP